MDKKKLLEIAGVEQLDEMPGAAKGTAYLSKLAALTDRRSGFVKLMNEFQRAGIRDDLIHRVIDALSDAYDNWEDRHGEI